MYAALTPSRFRSMRRSILFQQFTEVFPFNIERVVHGMSFINQHGRDSPGPLYFKQYYCVVIIVMLEFLILALMVSQQDK